MNQMGWHMTIQNSEDIHDYGACGPAVTSRVNVSMLLRSMHVATACKFALSSRSALLWFSRLDAQREGLSILRIWSTSCLRVGQRKRMPLND